MVLLATLVVKGFLSSQFGDFQSTKNVAHSYTPGNDFKKNICLQWCFVFPCWFTFESPSQRYVALGHRIFSMRFLRCWDKARGRRGDADRMLSISSAYWHTWTEVAKPPFQRETSWSISYDDDDDDGWSVKMMLMMTIGWSLWLS